MSQSFQIFKNIMFNHYFDFNGRADRKEYWYFILWITLISLPIIYLDYLVFGPDDFSDRNVAFSSAWEAITFFPLISVSARRLHDIGRTGWWQITPFIPIIILIPLLFSMSDGSSVPIFIWILFLIVFIALFTLLYFFCKKGDSLDNKYGSPNN